MKYLVLIVYILSCAWPVTAQNHASPIIDSLLRILPKQTVDSDRVKILVRLSDCYAASFPDTGIIYGKQAVLLAEKIGWQPGRAAAYYYLGFNSYNKSDYPAALHYLYRSLEINEAIHNDNGIANATRKIGNIHRDQKDYTKALDCYSKALAIFKKNNDRLGISRCYSNIGEIYGFDGRNKEAMYFNREALKIQEQIGYKNGMVISNYRIADIYMNELNYSMGLAHYVQALNITERYPAEIAKEQVEESLGGIGTCYLTIAKSHVSGNVSDDTSLAKAIGYLTRAVEIAREMKHLTDLRIYYGHLSEAEGLRNNYKEAYRYLSLSSMLNDSLFSPENYKLLSNVETEREKKLKDRIKKLEDVKKRNERIAFIVGIALLILIVSAVFRSYRSQKKLNRLIIREKQKVEQRTNELSLALEDLRTAQEEIVNIAKQKENEMIRTRISQDIHDDISSELTRISWISNVAKANAVKGDIVEIPSMLDKINASSLETTSKLSEIIWAINPVYDNLESMLAYMRSYASRFLSDTSFNYTIDFPDDVNIQVSPDFKRNLFLVLKEALNNAVKYSRATRLNIVFSISGKDYTLAVSDDGVGLDEDISMGKGNGMTNMRTRMKMLNGHCQFISSPGKGTAVIFTGSFT